MLTAIIRERYQKKKKTLLSVKIWIYSLGYGGEIQMGRTMEQKTKGQTMWNLCLINTAGLQLKLRRHWKLPFYSQRKTANGGSEIEYLVNEWTFSCQEIGMIIYSQQLVGLNIKEKLQETTSARRACLPGLHGKHIDWKIKKCATLCSHKCIPKGSYPVVPGHYNAWKVSIFFLLFHR